MPTFTLYDIDARVLDRLDGNSLLYPAQQRYDAINEALQCINLFAPFTMGTRDIPGFSITGQQFYAVPAGIVFPARVYFNGKQLQKVSLRSLTMRYRNWAIETSSMGQPVQEWVPLGLGMFLIHPNDSQGGQTISVNGVLEPVPLVAPNQTITIEDDFIELVEDYAFFILTIKESAAEFAGTSLTYQKFVHDIKEKSRWDSMKFGRYFVIGDLQKQGGAS